MVETITGLMTVLWRGERADKTEIDSAFGLCLTYHPGPKTVTTRAEIGQTCAKGSCPRGESPLTYMPAITSELVLGGPVSAGADR